MDSSWDEALCENFYCSETLKLMFTILQMIIRNVAVVSELLLLGRNVFMSETLIELVLNV